MVIRVVASKRGKATGVGACSTRQERPVPLLKMNPEVTIDKLELMQRQGMPLWRDILYVCMQSCNEINIGRRLHSLMVSTGFDSVSVLGDLLIRLFGACQSLFEANVVFGNIEYASEYTWQSIIWAHHVLGEHGRALELYEEMQQQQGLKLCKYVISTVLKSCGSIKELWPGMLAHRDTILAELHSDVVVGSCLIDMYANCCCLHEARSIFDNLRNRNEIVWNVMIEGYAQHGHAHAALYLFERMQENGIKPGEVTFLCILEVCEDYSMGLMLCRYLHNLILASQFESSVKLRSALVDTYARLGSLDEARALFDGNQNRSAIEWGAMISGYAQHNQGHLAVQVFEDMQQAGIQADEVLCSIVLKGISDKKLVNKGMKVHSQMIRYGIEADAVLGSSLIDMYTGFSDLNSARRMFDILPIKNVVSWSLMISAYATHADSSSALQLFLEMQRKGIDPDRVMFVCILNACSASSALFTEGRILHSQIVEEGLESDVSVSNNLVRMFAKCGSAEDALCVFDALSNQQSEAWSELISAYVQSGLDKKALELFERTQNEGILVDRKVLISILKSYGNIEALARGKIIHGQLINKEYKTDIGLGNALLDMYAKCKDYRRVTEVFGEMSNKDLLSWGTMMTVYNQSGESHQALQLFEKMQQLNMDPDIVSFSCALKACCGLGSLELGRVVHDQVLRSGLRLDMVAGNMLVNLYAKCGSVHDAGRVFEGMANRNQVSWNSMIAGYADYATLNLAEQCLADMEEHEVKPSAITYSSVLAACGHSGQAEESPNFFQSMTEKHQIVATNDHFNCIADNFARSGQLTEAKELLFVAPGPLDAPGWTSLLTACKVHANSEIGLQCYDRLSLGDHKSASVSEMHDT